MSTSRSSRRSPTAAAGAPTAAATPDPAKESGYRYVHSAIDDRTRLGYSEIHTNETGFTAAGFWRRAAAFYALAGIACERVLTDNGPCYRSKDFLTALKDTRTSR